MLCGKGIFCVPLVMLGRLSSVFGGHYEVHRQLLVRCRSLELSITMLVSALRDSVGRTWIRMPASVVLVFRR